MQVFSGRFTQVLLYWLWNILNIWAPLPRIYSKACVKRPLSKRLKLIFKTNYRLMQVRSIAECSNGSILQYFRPLLSYLSLRSLFLLFLNDRFAQVLLYWLWNIWAPLPRNETCVKRPHSKGSKIGFKNQLSLNAGQEYWRKLQREHSAILSTSFFFLGGGGGDRFTQILLYWLWNIGAPLPRIYSKTCVKRPL